MYYYSFKSSAGCSKKGSILARQNWSFQTLKLNLKCTADSWGTKFFFQGEKRVELPTSFHKWTLALLGKSFICQDSGKLLLTKREDKGKKDL